MKDTPSKSRLVSSAGKGQGSELHAALRGWAAPRGITGILSQSIRELRQAEYGGER